MSKKNKKASSAPKAKQSRLYFPYSPNSHQQKLKKPKKSKGTFAMTLTAVTALLFYFLTNITCIGGGMLKDVSVLFSSMVTPAATAVLMTLWMEREKTKRK